MNIKISNLLTTRTVDLKEKCSSAIDVLTVTCASPRLLESLGRLSCARCHHGKWMRDVATSISELDCIGIKWTMIESGVRAGIWRYFVEASSLRKESERHRGKNKKKIAVEPERNFPVLLKHAST